MEIFLQYPILLDIKKILAILLADLMLSGDNAVLIALATKRLDEAYRRKAMFIGLMVAAALRVFGVFAVDGALNKLPFAGTIFGFSLIYVGCEMMVDKEDSKEPNAVNSFWKAIGVIIFADFMMSMDNVLVVTGVAAGNFTIAAFGIFASILLLFFSSKLVTKALDRFPVLVPVAGFLVSKMGLDMAFQDTRFTDFLVNYIPVELHSMYLFSLGLLAIASTWLGMKYRSRMFRQKCQSGFKPSSDIYTSHDSIMEFEKK